MQLFSGDTMDIGHGEYTKYPVIIDPYFYAINSYSDEDAVVVNVDGNEQLTRIVTTQNYNISIKEGTIVFENHIQDTDFTWAHNGVREPIKKDALVVKVAIILDDDKRRK